MKCALPECDNESNRRFCSDVHANRGYSRRRAALARGEHLAPGEIPAVRRASAETSELTEQGAVNRIAAILEENGIDVENIGAVKAVRLNQWTALAKGEMVEDENGKKYREPTRVVDMESVGIVFHPSWADGPKWELPHPPAPVEVKVKPVEPVSLLTGWKTALILPDAQYGYRRDLQTAALDPFHDERAIDIALQIADSERPDRIICLGDWLDFAPFGKYQQEPAFALTIQPALDAAYSDLAMFRAFTKEMDLFEGNHDLRLQTMIIQNAKAAFGIKRAGAPPKEWPVMSVPFLLNLDELGITYVGGYPAGATYINDNLAAIHGKKIGNTSKSAASMVVEDERVSIIMGHTHHHEMRHKTRNSRGAPKFSVAYSPGCLCRIDGAVPSVKSGLDAFGKAVKSFEDWQQGVAIVRYQEGDGRFHIEPIEIIEGKAVHDKQEFLSRVTPSWV